ncbi:PQQ-like beta-propeller repeat protein [Blastopirellula sp. JC732]|uniref:PQQ-like beta-propeller repeat protein n=1 Tax=Blastopirellula sediminis TaxID=2894196 RepID=A0A9X1MLR6_9BACT|nr:PQQ-binding-like beta-propeller repeat protein [Blastopirellula sediminis]MCC9609394.1 PQQ-like beta-propeller repeat protein [Blastopirellula sediminis]MCC9627829.1 PQQ-like beta-propeller repeat protein [Blastopirellula sediminis]
MRSTVLQTLGAISAILLLAVTATAEDWPHWRGPNRDDVTSDRSGWSSDGWIKSPPAWTKNVDEGSSSPIVVGDRLFAIGWKANKDHVVCLQASTGKEIWSVSYNCPRYGRQATGDQGLYGGPTSTPEYDPATGYLYTLSCDGDLNCWDAGEKGRQVWSLNLYDIYKVEQRPRIGRSGRRDYGYTTAPLVHGDWLIVEIGAQAGTLAAFDKRTGKQIWLSEAKGFAGHAGGLAPIEVEGVPSVAAFTFQGLLVTRLDPGHAGETVAEYEWMTSFANSIATPAVFDNYILITSEYNRNAICKLEIRLTGAKKIWEQPLASKICSPIVHAGHVYWCWQRLYCLDFETGVKVWEGGDFGDAGSCILTGDDRLILWGGRGTLALTETAQRSPGSFRELAKVENVFSEDVWPHVVLANGQIFCKGKSGDLKCFRVP